MIPAAVEIAERRLLRFLGLLLRSLFVSFVISFVSSASSEGVQDDEGEEDENDSDSAVDVVDDVNDVEMCLNEDTYDVVEILKAATLVRDAV